MRQSARACLTLCVMLVLWVVGHGWSSAAEGAHPEGFDARKIETDKRALEERKSEEKREDSEAWFKKSVEGKDLTREPKAEFHDADRLLEESEKRQENIQNKDDNKDPFGKRLNSDLTMRQALGSEGKTIAGSGGKVELRDEPRLVDQYGGNKGEWSKMSGMSNGKDVHWYENSNTGMKVEPKIK